MNANAVRKRLERLEAVLIPDDATCIVRLENGSEIEVTVAEYIKNIDRMERIRMGHCTLENLKEVGALLDAELAAMGVVWNDET